VILSIKKQFEFWEKCDSETYHSTNEKAFDNVHWTKLIDPPNFGGKLEEQETDLKCTQIISMEF